jgi:hypothetical protein
MRARRTACSLLTASIAALALPALAGAEYLVPPGNSAATQYTESVPTAGGHRDAEKESQQKSRTPSQVLGSRTSKQLEAQGEAGREVAEFAAETAPETQGAAPVPSEGGAIGTQQAEKGDEKKGGSIPGQGPPGSSPSGSGGVGEVIGQATGGSSGELGLPFPLALVATIAWAVAYLLLMRQRPTQ